MKLEGLDLVPRKSYPRREGETERRFCQDCATNQSIESFRIITKKGGSSGRLHTCMDCESKKKSDQRSNFKQICLDYKTSQTGLTGCEICGYNRCNQALEFHHVDPKQKDFRLSKNRTKVGVKVREELDKCMVVCANCHREIHNGVIDLEGNDLLTVMKENE